ncbi:3-deoxy-D-manno-octulosonic acid transferase [Lysobacter helvus]|uniref:3-deoxy-D-manno-octulosonic acid transferase n=2 Tax=Lysobacteraceae TaxID=32033 RepID=A0ABM7Q5A9_9GAMM|nr:MULTISPECIES: DUF3800 domain-containing protein [Lysobacter]BCT92513.1 3-deoxy-D-manno-octulosonic acid transferase [Lysobacter caseinilyticus]BCT95666.1 3-deoxy-D-manno-octulosonic acid transferase [Lysobacter helvus]
MPPFSDYIVFADESGDHGLERVNPQYPVFVLSFCIFQKTQYVERVVPAIQRFKLRYFGHDQVVLHERDIRRDLGHFKALKRADAKAAFLEELTGIMRDAEFGLVCSVIDKQRLKRRYAAPRNPYHVALAFGLERVHGYLAARGQSAVTHVVVERRGKREDAELQAEFDRICAGSNFNGAHLPLRLVFAGKQANATGLQMADLVARPVGMRTLRPTQANRAFDALAGKFHRNRRGESKGWGLKVFP